MRQVLGVGDLVTTDAPANPFIIAVEPVTVDKPTACAMLGIRERKLMQLVASGDLNARKLGARTVFNVQDLKDFASKLPSWEPKA